MTYRLIKLLDCLQLETCTCFIGLDETLKSFILGTAISLICLHLLKHHLKGWIYKTVCIPVKAAFAFYRFYLQYVSKLKGCFLSGIMGLPKLRQLVKLALYIWGSPYLDGCWEIAANQADGNTWKWTSAKCAWSGKLIHSKNEHWCPKLRWWHDKSTQMIKQIQYTVWHKQG